MVTGWIVVGPVNNAALRVPFVHTIERDGISRFQRRNSRCQVNVMRDEQRLTGRKRDDEALMTTTISIVGEKLRHYAFSLNLNAASLFIERSLNYIGRTGLLTARVGRLCSCELAEPIRLSVPNVKGCRDCDNQQKSLH